METEKIYNLIKKWIKDKGYSPSLRDLAKESGMSMSGLHYHILKLKAENKISYEPRIARSIRIVGD